MELSAKKREKLGKAVKALREEGLIPAELYGRGLQNMHLVISAKEFNKTFKEAGESTVVTVNIEGDKRPALIYDISRDPVQDTVEHVDLYQVRMDEKIKTHVPLEFVGVAPAVKEKGGILTKAMHEIEVEALPGDLPHDIKVDISTLDDINKSIYVKDIAPIKGVELLADPETVIASITEKVAEEVAVAPPSVEDVVVETEEKKKERDATKAEGGADEPAPKAQAKEEKK